ncbi:hypothetical protein PFISCL1PPCAC_18344, partial [Pristionchus fissidentatus]
LQYNHFVLSGIDYFVIAAIGFSLLVYAYIRKSRAALIALIVINMLHVLFRLGLTTKFALDVKVTPLTLNVCLLQGVRRAV